MTPLRKPQTAGGVIYLAVVSAALIGLVLVAWGNWRLGVTVMGACLALGAVPRYFLGEHSAGMLRVRRRWFDVLIMVVVGVALIALALTIPNQPDY